MLKPCVTSLAEAVLSFTWKLTDLALLEAGTDRQAGSGQRREVPLFRGLALVTA